MKMTRLLRLSLLGVAALLMLAAPTARMGNGPQAGRV